MMSSTMRRWTAAGVVALTPLVASAGFVAHVGGGPSDPGAPAIELSFGDTFVNIDSFLISQSSRHEDRCAARHPSPARTRAGVPRLAPTVLLSWLFVETLYTPKHCFLSKCHRVAVGPRPSQVV